MLVSCGAEEVVQGGIYSFAQDHFPEFDKHQTWFLVLDTVGSRSSCCSRARADLMEDYFDRGSGIWSRASRIEPARRSDVAFAPATRPMP